MEQSDLTALLEADGQIEVDSIELVPFSSINDADLRRCGETDLESLRRRAAHAGPIHDTLVHRISPAPRFGEWPDRTYGTARRQLRPRPARRH